jgi:hypothetical protein
MNVSIINSLWTIMTGERLDLDDPDLAKVVDWVDQLLHGASPISPVVAVLPHPSMVFLLPGANPIKLFTAVIYGFS